MNIFVSFFYWLKTLFANKYKKECIDKQQLLDFLDKKLPNKKKFSLKDLVDKVKTLI